MRTRAACLFAVSCIALSGCGTGASTVEQQSEATLYYPGSHVIYGDTVPQNVICIDDCHPAGRTVTLEASANAQQIMSWYGAKLRAAGWSLDPYDKGTNATLRSGSEMAGPHTATDFRLRLEFNTHIRQRTGCLSAQDSPTSDCLSSCLTPRLPGH